MLVTVQFPIADMRSFAPGPQRRLSKPAWPDAHPGGEFVRGIGGVDVRRLGGLNGWIGEGTHCRASRLITLDKLPALTLMNAADYPFGHAIQTRLKFRRLYVDGKALAKCEVGFAGGAFRGDWGVQYDFLNKMRRYSNAGVPGSGGDKCPFGIFRQGRCHSVLAMYYQAVGHSPRRPANQKCQRARFGCCR